MEESDRTESPCIYVFGNVCILALGAAGLEISAGRLLFYDAGAPGGKRL